MDLENNYKKLYKLWLEEINNENLSNLDDEKYATFNKLLKSIKGVPLLEKEKLKIQFIKEYQENVTYMMEDLLSLRKVKLINFALAMSEVDFTALIESEKFLYQNLVSAFKGYDKIKRMNLQASNEQISKEKWQKIEDSRKEPQIDIKLEKTDEIRDFKSECDYKMIRILKDTPALVGFDLKTYGPFQKEDVVNMPDKNAEILVNEKFAEFFDVS